MRPRDHNKALAVLNAVIGSYCVLPLLASPWILAKNIDTYPSPRRTDQIAIVVIVCALLVIFGTLFLSTAYGAVAQAALGAEDGVRLRIRAVVYFPLLGRLHLVVHALGRWPQTLRRRGYA